MKYFFLVLFFAGSVICNAQSNYIVNTSGLIRVGAILDISMTNLVNLTSFSSINDYQNGVTSNNYASFAIKSNATWMVNVSAQSAYFNALTPNASADMPASILGIRVNGASNFTPISTSNVQVKTGSRGNTTTPGNTFNIDLKFSPGFNYKGGQYNINLLYTLTAN